MKTRKRGQEELKESEDKDTSKETEIQSRAPTHPLAHATTHCSLQLHGLHGSYRQKPGSGRDGVSEGPPVPEPSAIKSTFSPLGEEASGQNEPSSHLVDHLSTCRGSRRVVWRNGSAAVDLLGGVGAPFRRLEHVQSWPPLTKKRLKHLLCRGSMMCFPFNAFSFKPLLRSQLRLLRDMVPFPAQGLGPRIATPFKPCRDPHGGNPGLASRVLVSPGTSTIAEKL